MKNLTRLFSHLALLLITALFLTGCATQSPLDQVKTSGAPGSGEAAITVACFEYQKFKDEQEMSMYSGMNSADKERALSTRSMMQAAVALAGKDKDQCRPGTNVWDATIAWVKEREQTNRVYAHEGGSTLRFASGVSGGVMALDKLGGMVGDKVAGNKTESGRDTNQAQEGISNSGTNTATETHYTQTQVSHGNGSIEPASTNTAPSSSPAQTTTQTKDNTTTDNHSTVPAQQ